MTVGIAAFGVPVGEEELAASEEPAVNVDEEDIGVLLPVEPVTDDVACAGVLESLGSEVAEPELLGRLVTEPTPVAPDPTGLEGGKNGEGVSGLWLPLVAGKGNDTRVVSMEVKEVVEGVTDPVGELVDASGVVAAARELPAPEVGVAPGLTVTVEDGKMLRVGMVIVLAEPVLLLSVRADDADDVEEAST